jgi:hypothetical protein
VVFDARPADGRFGVFWGVLWRAFSRPMKAALLRHQTPGVLDVLAEGGSLVVVLLGWGASERRRPTEEANEDVSGNCLRKLSGFEGAHFYEAG